MSPYTRWRTSENQNCPGYIQLFSHFPNHQQVQDTGRFLTETFPPQTWCGLNPNSASSPRAYLLPTLAVSELEVIS